MKRLLAAALVLMLSGCATLQNLGLGQYTPEPVPAQEAQAILRESGGVYRLQAGLEPLGRAYVLVSGAQLRVDAPECGTPQFVAGDFALMRSTCVFDGIATFADIPVVGEGVTVRALVYVQSDSTQPLELCYPTDICETGDSS